MALNANKVNKSKKDFGQAKAGSQMARICRVLDLGLQPREPWEGQEKPPAYMIRLTFELPKDRIDVDGESKPRWIDVEFPLSQHEKSKCYQWYNILDPENKYNGDWGKLLGAPCLLEIKHRTAERTKKTYANVKNVMPLMEGLEVPALENPTVLFDTTSPNIDVFLQLPEWLQDVIKGNLEFQNSKLDRLLSDQPIVATASTGDPHDEVAEADIRPQKIKPEIEVPMTDFDEDDDQPF